MTEASEENTGGDCRTGENRFEEPIVINKIHFKNRILRSSLGGRMAYYDGVANPTSRTSKRNSQSMTSRESSLRRSMSTKSDCLRSNTPRSWIRKVRSLSKNAQPPCERWDAATSSRLATPARTRRAACSRRKRMGNPLLPGQDCYTAIATAQAR